MRAAKERKRLAESQAASEVGRIIFTGQMFRGNHTMILRHVDGERHLRPEMMDGPTDPSRAEGYGR